MRRPPPTEDFLEEPKPERKRTPSSREIRDKAQGIVREKKKVSRKRPGMDQRMFKVQGSSTKKIRREGDIEEVPGTEKSEHKFKVRHREHGAFI